ncbi:P-loop NTPase fold protein [Aeromonas veronii]|uniref:P-loop NTPase fold protein n=1 Tax=Aeromonas veronii TaxID=654 RepID=UPI002A6B69D4|nr:P-loop NTPase fold protein [Aeromonas veronii]
MKQTKQILEILTDTSFPKVILIDGSWGCGKTYFIKNHLIGKLKERFKQDVHFFSLYGISSIDDFRDKIISLSMTEQEETSVLAKYFSKIVDGAATNLGERGIGAIISGAAGAYKYKLYNELDNFILILDDLERVYSEGLIKNILGECLNLAEEKNIKVIVVANESKIECKYDIEKVFADKYRFSFTHEEVIAILKREYNTLNDQLFNELLLNITAIDSKNIRVIKRAVTKFIRLKDEIDSLNDVIVDQALSRLLSDIIRFCYAKFECGFSKEEIISSIETKGVRRLLNSKENIENHEFEQLDKIFNQTFYLGNKKLADFCCDGIFDFSDIKNDLNLPIKTTLLDAMLSPWGQNQLTPSDFKLGLNRLQSLIRQEESNIDLYTWFNVCDTYIYMIDHQVVDSSVFSKQKILDICNNVDVSHFTSPLKQDDFHNINLYNQELINIYTSKKKTLDELTKKDRNSEFSKKFQESWNSVKSDVYNDLMHTPIFQDINVDIIRKALLNWTNEEVFQFVRFNNHRYRFSNIQDYFEPEINALKEMSSMLNELSIELKIGLKVASINDLNSYITDAYMRMESNLGRNSV